MIRFISLLLPFFLFFGATYAQSNKSLRLLKAGKFEKAIEITKGQKKEQTNSVKYHHFLAKAHVLLGDDIEAEKELSRALEILNRKEKIQRLTLQDFDVIDELSLLYVRTGNWSKARNLIDRSLKNRVRKWKKKDPSNSRPYLPLGLLFYSQNKLDSASFYLNSYAKNLRNSNYTNYLDIDKYADVYQILADVSLKQNELKEATKFARKSLRLQRHIWTKRQVGKNYPDQIRALNTLTKISFELNEYKRAERFNKIAIRIFENHGEKQEFLQAKIYLNRSKIEYELGNDTATIDLLQRVMKLQLKYVNTTFVFLSEYEKENVYDDFNSTNKQITQLAAKILIRQNTREHSFTKDVMNFVINSKALILNESNKLIANASNKESLLNQRLIKWKELKNQWLFLSTSSKRSNRKRSEEILEEVVQFEKSLINDLNVSDQVDWESIASELIKDELAIEMVDINLSDSLTSFLILSVSNQFSFPEWKVCHLPLSRDKYINYYKNAMKYGIQDTLTHKLLSFPESTSKVFISPASVLHQINFNAIQNPLNQFLVDNYEIVNLSNTRTLAKRVKSEPKLEKAVLIGLSDFSSIEEATYSDLPGVKVEINEIQTLMTLNKMPHHLFLNENDLVQKLQRSSDFEILHIATHGYYDEENIQPMLGSGLILTSDSSLNQLTAYEASLLDLENTRLVVLSACGSGLGQINNGEGVYGLQRAFEVAGVDNIIMSLWEIDDEFTQYFMITFYSNLIELNDVSAAFSKTLTIVKQQNSDPKYWGAFKLVQFF